MERELDNANPTILNISQLPSRRNGGPAKGAAALIKGPWSRYDELLAETAGLELAADSPFYSPSSSEPDSDDAESIPGFTSEPIDEQEIYDLISTISDPEHPHTLGQLSVINLPDIHITHSATGSTAAASTAPGLSQVLINVTPTITHCSLATVIGLAVRVRLEQALPPNFRVDVRIKEGTHSQDDQVNKQLSDKERVAAALENETLRGVLDKMLATCI